MVEREYQCKKCGCVQVLSTAKRKTVVHRDEHRYTELKCKRCHTPMIYASDGPKRVFLMGKHQGKSIADVARIDQDYLVWSLQQSWLPQFMREAITDTLTQLWCQDMHLSKQGTL